LEDKDHLYFKNAQEWREWLHKNHLSALRVYLIFYKVDSAFASMRWEEAVQVALCYGWIDSTVKKLDEHSRRQLFTPRKEKSVWSKVNKTYIKKLIAENQMHESGLRIIEIAKQNGSWESLDQVEALVLPKDLETAFLKNKIAFDNYNAFSKTYKKSYLYWLNQAKKIETRKSRIEHIVKLCEENCKTR
jgi:uncharacterized protein YdeI (YjbR/CyaY-like superfamily)